mmetsp:Transcript_10915/g.21578  ORF Transcript_10915/g.21578 Transcript_10915/m.21578 type:complete len:239 (+) Transcript_10915:744-1460(+)
MTPDPNTASDVWHHDYSTYPEKEEPAGKAPHPQVPAPRKPRPHPKGELRLVDKPVTIQVHVLPPLRPVVAHPLRRRPPIPHQRLGGRQRPPPLHRREPAEPARLGRRQLGGHHVDGAQREDEASHRDHVGHRDPPRSHRRLEDAQRAPHGDGRRHPAGDGDGPQARLGQDARRAAGREHVDPVSLDGHGARQVRERGGGARSDQRRHEEHNFGVLDASQREGGPCDGPRDGDEDRLHH